MKAIHIRRLRKLIAFLRTLPRKRFNFAIVRNEPPKCGAVGCAIGYMPNVFPRVFRSVKSYDVNMDEVRRGGDWTHDIAFRGRSEPSFDDIAVWLTGMFSHHRAGLLFSPGRQAEVDSRLTPVPEDATPKQVARMLEKFIELQTEGAK